MGGYSAKLSNICALWQGDSEGPRNERSSSGGRSGLGGMNKGLDMMAEMQRKLAQRSGLLLSQRAHLFDPI